MKDNYFYLNALIKGTSKEIQILYNKEFPKIKSFIFKNKGNAQDAEDIFQKALLQMTVRYKKEKFKINTTFEGYLFTVCKNLWRRELNKRKNRVTSDKILPLLDENQDIAMSILEQKRWELFNESLELISDNCKKILRLFFAKTSYGDMMAIFNYNSENVVRQRVFKCKNKLKEIIKSDKRYVTLKEL